MTEGVFSTPKKRRRVVLDHAAAFVIRSGCRLLCNQALVVEAASEEAASLATSEVASEEAASVLSEAASLEATSEEAASVATEALAEAASEVEEAAVEEEPPQAVIPTASARAATATQTFLIFISMISLSYSKSSAEQGLSCRPCSQGNILVRFTEKSRGFYTKITIPAEILHINYNLLPEVKDFLAVCTGLLPSLLRKATSLLRELARSVSDETEGVLQNVARQGTNKASVYAIVRPWERPARQKKMQKSQRKLLQILFMGHKIAIIEAGQGKHPRTQRRISR